MTSPGISISGRGENSCSINSIGKSGSRSCGVNGARVPGCSGGSIGSGNDGRTLTQTSGIWLSRRRNLECSDMGDTTITEGERASLSRGKTGDRRDCQRISGKRRRKSMAVSSVPGGHRRPANCAGNLVSVPGLRGIATQISLKPNSRLLRFGFGAGHNDDEVTLSRTGQLAHLRRGLREAFSQPLEVVDELGALFLVEDRVVFFALLAAQLAHLGNEESDD